MKTKLTKTPILRSKWHYGVAISAFVFLVFLALAPSAAQQKNSKRITGVRLGTASEGSRVSVFSDTALSDYEAFRRGDRFYVRIPAAHFLVPQPQFRGAGFQHVQVQKIGDSIVISFWLQPGASAYVEQHATKLDIVFGSAGGANPAGTGATTSSPTQAPAQTGQAGPISPASRNESVTRSATQSPNTQLPSNTPTSTGATDQNSSVTSQTDPTTSASPASTAGVPLSSSTPAPHAYAQPAKRDWRNSYVMQWYRLNQKVAIAAAILILIALALLVWWLVARIRRRPKPQPKVVAKDLVKSKTATAPVMAPVKARPQQESLEPVSVSERPNLRVVEKPKPAPDAEEREAFIEFVDGMKLRDSALPLTAASLATPPSPAAPSVPPVPSLQENLAAEEERLLQEEEALRRAADELENRKREAEIAIRVKEEARLKAETEAQLRAEVEARIRAEEEARIRAEHEERVRLETAARLRAEDEARFQLEAQTLRRAAEELARKRAEAEAVRKLAEEEARRQAEEEMRRKVEEEMRRRAEEEARLKAEHELKLRLEEESRAEAEARRLAEEEPVRVEREAEARGLAEEVRIKAEAEAEIRRQAEEARRLAEEQRLLDEERLRREAEERRVVEARRLLMEQEALTQAAAELVRRRAEIEESRKQAEEEARLLAETRERVQAEAEAARRRVAEERERLEAEANRRVEEEHQKLEEARRLAEEKHRQIEEATRLQAREEEQRLMELEALRKKSEEESRRRAEQERRIRSEIDALHRAEEEQRRRIEVETQRRIELEARLKEEHARQQAEDVARLKAQEETRRLAEEARARAEEETKHNDASLERNERVELPALPDDVDKESENQAVATPVMEHLAQSKDIEAIHKEKGIIPVDGESGIPAELIEKLNAQESSERAAALTDIARYGSDDAFHHVSKAFDDQSPDVRNAAARALYSLHPDRAASFTRALREGTSERRRRIGSALAASGLASDAIANLTGESRERTYDAFSLLFLMAKAGEVQPLVKAIEDYPNIEVRLAVVKLLALSGQPEIVPAFRRLAVRASLPAEVRSAVMEAIYQISTQTRESASSAA